MNTTATTNVSFRGLITASFLATGRITTWNGHTAEGNVNEVLLHLADDIHRYQGYAKTAAESVAKNAAEVAERITNGYATEEIYMSRVGDCAREVAKMKALIEILAPLYRAEFGCPLGEALHMLHAQVQPSKGGQDYYNEAWLREAAGLLKLAFAFCEEHRMREETRKALEKHNRELAILEDIERRAAAKAEKLAARRAARKAAVAS